MRFTIPADHPSLPGHFPGRPLVPGVLLLDRVLEAIEREHGALGPLRLPQVKFLQPLLPGEQARVELEPAGVSGAPPRWRFRVWRDATLLASGEVVAAEIAGAGADGTGTGVPGADAVDADSAGAARAGAGFAGVAAGPAP